MSKDETATGCATCKALQDRAYLDAYDQPSSSVWFPREPVEELVCDVCKVAAQLADLYAAYDAEEDFQVKGDLAGEIRRLEDFLAAGDSDEDDPWAQPGASDAWRAAP